MLVVYILIHMFYTRSYIELQRVDAVHVTCSDTVSHFRQACMSISADCRTFTNFTTEVASQAADLAPAPFPIAHHLCGVYVLLSDGDA